MRTHLSKLPIEQLAERSQQGNIGFKPNGFWYSVDGDWEEWVEDNMPDWRKERIHEYEVALGTENILRLTNAADILSFGKQYKTSLVKEPVPSEIEEFLMVPDWIKVAEEYDGIEIAPYCWPLRLEVQWYYPWDCASGCLWRPKDTTLKLLEAVCKS